MNIASWRQIGPLQALAAAMVVSGAVTAAVLLLVGAGQGAETALSYNLLTTKQVTYPGSYSFLEDATNVVSDAYRYPPLPGHPDAGPFGLLVHATDADGTLHKDFYNGIAAGDRFDVWADDRCFIRYVVTEVLPDLKSVHTVKVFEVDHLTSVLSSCTRHDHLKADATIPVTFRWHVAPGVEGEDGIRVMLVGEPTPGAGRYRIEDTKLVITIPADMTLVIVGGGIPHGGEVVVILEDVESGSQLALGVGSGTEVGRVIETPPTSPSGGGGQSSQSARTTRDVGALFDELAKSAEIVP